MTNPATEVAGVVDLPWKTVGKAIVGGGILLAGYKASQALYGLAARAFTEVKNRAAPNMGTQSSAPAAATEGGWS